MRGKRGQGGGAAAGVVAIVALLIVLYILLLPTDIRNELLNTTTTSKSPSRSSTLEASVLVFEHPGTLDPVKLRDREKVLDSFNLYTEKSAVILKSAEAIHIESGWLRNKDYNLSFKVDDLEHTENYIVAFDVAASVGRIILTFNGKEIYNSIVPTGNVPPIKIEKEDVKEQNSLILSVSGVGLAFWRLNEYDLRNVRAIADFTDISKREYRNFFVISATERANFERTKLNFVPDCLTERVGPLQIFINDRALHYGAIPDCGALSSIEFDPNYLKQGENTIVFKAEEGNYFIDRVSIKADLKELQYPYYYFELKARDFELVENRTANVTLELQFPDRDDKIAELDVNGHLSSIDTSNSTYRKNINVFVEEGQNYLQIVPKTILNIIDLRVILEK
jgi:hypothetical protein